MNNELLIGSHVGMSGKKMMEGSVEEALSYGANTFMIYTGAPQNTRRKPVEELCIDKAWNLMKDNGIEQFVVHAPYIINLANTIKPETFELATDFLKVEVQRCEAMGSKVLILLEKDQSVYIALETMAGKGSEIGRSFEELAAIYDGVIHSDRLRVCFDTCHTHDSGYDIINDFDGVIDKFNKIIGIDQIAVFHINDSKNPCGASKDRHANIGDGYIGFEALNKIVHDERFQNIPKILETPYIVASDGNKYPP